MAAPEVLNALCPPDPVTIAYVGFWVAPIDRVSRGVAAFLPRRTGKRATPVILVLDLLAGAYGLAFWLLALVGVVAQAGVVVPDSSSVVEFILGVAGLDILVAIPAGFALRRLSLRLTGAADLDETAYSVLPGVSFDRWMTGAGLIGFAIGILLYAFVPALH